MKYLKLLAFISLTVFLLIVLLGSFSTVHQVSAQTVGSPQGISTFNSIGVYWNPPSASSSKVASMQYKPAGSADWKPGFDLWYSRDDNQYRGSLVHLTPNTTYDIKLQLEGTSENATFQSKTWTEDFPIGQIIELPENSSQPLMIYEEDGGSADGYTLYTHASGKTATIDVQDNHKYNVYVRAQYVIIRGLTLKNGSEHAVFFGSGAQNVVIEENDISGWGRVASDDRFGKTHGAIHSNTNESASRIIIQRNKIHHPRHDTNSWGETRSDISEQPWGTHPGGPQAVYLYNTGGNHVIRYNSIYSDNEHRFNDCIGGGANFGDKGFPRKDSDIHGNYMEKCWDNGIEAEGGNKNIRIWGNYFTETYRPLATRDTNVGPAYIWRNVSDVIEKFPKEQYSWSDDPGGSFHKAGGEDGDDWGVFEFHNTVLQPTISGVTRKVGAKEGPQGPMDNTITRNNIFQVYCPDSCYSIDMTSGSNYNDYDYDLYNGKLDIPSGQESHGIKGVPIYAGNNAFNSSNFTGSYTLASNSPGFDQGVVINNFNTGYTNGTAPDIGAHEAGMPAMEFGVNAYLNGEPYSNGGDIVTPPEPEPTDCEGDYNDDGAVDIADFGVFGINYKKQGIDCGLDLAGEDCYLGIQDFAIFANGYKVSCDGSEPPPSDKVTIYLKEDTYVRDDYPDRANGSNTVLKVEGSPIKISLLKFDLSDISGVSSATLYLKASAEASNYSQGVYAMTDTTWSESSTTYNTMPSISAQFATIPSVASDTWASVDITGYISQNEGKITSLALKMADTDGVYYYSRESTFDPYIEITK